MKTKFKEIKYDHVDFKIEAFKNEYEKIQIIKIPSIKIGNPIFVSFLKII